jgi:phosphoenolpyruvate synthase/pyruvate phosphate dikinase
MKEISIVKVKNNLSYESVLKQLDVSKKERQIFDVAKRSVYLKDLKDDFRRQGVFYGQILFKEIARRMNISLKDISYLLEAEILLFLDKGKCVSKEVIKERKSGFILFFDSNNKIICKTGKEIKTILRKFGFKNDKEVLSEIKGVSASLGRAKGIVTIIKKVVDLKNMKKGNILVSISTHPDYIAAMQKASAIITEEGGLTSHAAIVARELNIPCIVGTKIATKILKDGNVVEVDANKGVVTILKK